MKVLGERRVGVEPRDVCEVLMGTGGADGCVVGRHGVDRSTET